MIKVSRKPKINSIKQTSEFVRKPNPENQKMTEKISVCVKFRPLLGDWEDYECWIVDTKGSRVFAQKGLIKDQKSKRISNSQDIFTFDMVADAKTSNQNVYERILKPITKSVLKGYNGSAFMYGQTTSGKTYTMQGTDANPGL